MRGSVLVVLYVEKSWCGGGFRAWCKMWGTNGGEIIDLVPVNDQKIDF